MTALLGTLGDGQDLSARARRYANEVVFGDTWPLGPGDVDLARVTFETSTRMRRKHGTCVADGDGTCTVRIAQETNERAGFEALQETIRHELVHVHQHQADGAELGHGESFERWVDPLALSGRCSNHYKRSPAEYAYTFHCPNCGFIGGRYRLCKTVRAARAGDLYCQQCDSRDVTVREREGSP